MSDFYILDSDNNPITATMEEWSKFNGDRCTKRVAFDENDDVRVSTVFLGMNHNWGEGPPILFETMIFGGDHDEYQWRYVTWDEAIAGHKSACLVAGIKHEKE